MPHTMTPSGGSLHSKLVSLSASHIHDLSMDYSSEDNHEDCGMHDSGMHDSGMYYTYSFHSKTVSLPPSAIDCLSIDRYNLDSDDDSCSDSDQYSFDYNSCDYDSEYDLENLDPESTFQGTFRWTDLTKFSDENPELIRRRHSFDQSVSMSRHSCSISKHNDMSGQRPKRRRRKKKDQSTTGTAKPVATLKKTNSSPNLVQDETDTLMKNATSDNSKSRSTRTNSKSCSTELGERISLLLSSPTNSPRSVMAAFDPQPQLTRKTLKTQPTTKPKGRIAPLKDTPGKVFRDDLSMDDSINTLQDEEEFWCIMQERRTVE